MSALTGVARFFSKSAPVQELFKKITAETPKGLPQGSHATKIGDLPKDFLAIFKNLPQELTISNEAKIAYWLAYNLLDSSQQLDPSVISQCLIRIQTKLASLEKPPYELSFDKEELFSKALGHLINGHQEAIEGLCGELDAAGYNLESQELLAKQAMLKAQADIVDYKLQEKNSEKKEVEGKIAGLINEDLSLWTYKNHDNHRLKGEVDELHFRIVELDAEIKSLKEEKKGLKQAMAPAQKQVALLQYKTLQSLGVEQEKLDLFLAELSLSEDAVPKELQSEVERAKQAVQAKAPFLSVEKVIYTDPVEALNRAATDYQFSAANSPITEVLKQYEAIEKQYGVGPDNHYSYPVAEHYGLEQDHMPEAVLDPPAGWVPILFRGEGYNPSQWALVKRNQDTSLSVKSAQVVLSPEALLETVEGVELSLIQPVTIDKAEQDRMELEVQGARANLVRALRANPSFGELNQLGEELAFQVEPMQALLLKGPAGFTKNEDFLNILQDQAYDLREYYLENYDRILELRDQAHAMIKTLEGRLFMGEGSEFKELLLGQIAQLQEIVRMIDEEDILILCEGVLALEANFDLDQLENFLKTDGLVLITAITAGVLMMTGVGMAFGAGMMASIPGMALSASVMGVGSLVGSELGMYASGKFFHTGMKSYYQRYQDGEITEDQLGDYYFKSWAQNSATVFVFMGVGRVAGYAATRMALSANGSVSQAGQHVLSVGSFIQKGFDRLQFLKPQTAMGRFLVRTGVEVGSEVGEEGFETTAHNIHPVLGAIATTINSMDGRNVEVQLLKAGVTLSHQSMAGLGPALDFNYSAGKAKALQAKLAELYPDVEITELSREVFEVSVPNGSDTVVYRFTPSQDPYALRRTVANAMNSGDVKPVPYKTYLTDTIGLVHEKDGCEYRVTEDTDPEAIEGRLKDMGMVVYAKNLDAEDPYLMIYMGDTAVKVYIRSWRVIDDSFGTNNPDAVNGSDYNPSPANGAHPEALDMPMVVGSDITTGNILNGIDAEVAPNPSTSPLVLIPTNFDPSLQGDPIGNVVNTGRPVIQQSRANLVRGPKREENLARDVQIKAPRVQEAVVSIDEPYEIETNFLGIKTAHFKANTYQSSFEPALREAGVDMVVIDEPSSLDRERLEEKGYHYKSEKIIWRMPTQSLEEYRAGLKGKKRRRFDSKLKKSEGVQVEASSLTVSEFEEWYEIYEAEVVGKTKGRRTIEPTWARDRSLREYKKVFFRDPDTNELMGGAILRLNPKTQTCTITYAAYKSEYRDKELSIRTFTEAMTLGGKDGMHQLSYGMDTNLYGQHLSVGLMEYKASLGFTPRAGKKKQLLKVLNPDKLDEDYFFFAINGSEPLRGHYFSDQPRNLTTPAQSKITTHPRQSQNLPDEQPSILMLLLNVDSMEDVEELSKLYYEISSGNESSLNGYLSRAARTDPLYKTLIIINLLRSGHGSLGIFSEIASTKIDLSETTQSNDLDWDSALAKDSSFLGKVAAFLGTKKEEAFWRIMLTEVLLDKFGSIQALETAPYEEVAPMIAHTLHNIRKIYGEEAMIDVLDQLNTFFDMSHLMEANGNTASLNLSEPRGHLTIAGLDLANYIPAEHLAKANALVQELYELLFIMNNSMLYHRYAEIYTETLGGLTVSLIKGLLNVDEGARGLLFNSREWGSYGYARRAREVLENIYELLNPFMGKQKSPVQEAFSEEMVSRARIMFGNISGIQNLLMKCQINPASISMWGRSPKDIFDEIFERATKEQLIAIVHEVKKRYPGWNERHLINALKDLEDKPITEPLQELEIDIQEMESKEKTISELFVISGKGRELNDSIRQKLGLESGHYEDGTPNKLAKNIIQEYIATNGTLPTLDVEETAHLLLEHAVAASDGSPLCFWLRNHPEVDIGVMGHRSLLKSLKEGFANSYHGTDDSIVYLFILLGNEELATEAQEVLLSIRSNYTINYHGKRYGNSYKDLEKSLSQAQNSEEYQAAVKGVSLKLLNNFLQSEDNIFSDDAFLFFFDLFQNLDISREEYWNLLKEKASKFPWQCKKILENLIEVNNTSFSEVDWQSAKEVFIAVLGSKNQTHEFEKEFFVHFSNVDWPADGFEEPNLNILKWVEYQASREKLTPQQLAEITNWAIDHPDYVSIDVVFFQAVKLLSNIDDKQKRQELYQIIKRQVAQIPFVEPNLYFEMVETLEQIDPLGEENAVETIFDGTFFEQHPWGHYGYSEEVIHKIKKFSQQEDFTVRHARALLTLLFSHNNKRFNQIWISQLITSTPDQGFHTLVRFLNYWQSLSQDSRDIYLDQRMQELFGEIRVKVGKNALGNGYYKVKDQVEALQAAGKPVPSGLLNRKNLLDKYRQLFKALAEAPNQDQEREISEQIDDEILQDFPPKIKPDEEKQLIIQGQVQAFQNKLGLSRRDSENFRQSITGNTELWQGSGVFDRFVQYSGFADEQGMAMLRHVVVSHTDPEFSRVEEVQRPDLGGKSTKHFNYFGKFSELEATLLERGVDPSEVSNFMERYKELWQFDKIPDTENDYFSVTHDLERWAKHGEEPRLSCQRISSKSGNMGINNWNYQFGPNPNANGRPLARMMLGQLKLAEYRENGKVVSRSVLEVTVKIKEGKPMPALLVEASYAAHSFTKNGEFDDAIRRYAQSLGIEESEIYFANDIKWNDESSYPSPLPEKHRIYRDSFRP